MGKLDIRKSLIAEFLEIKKTDQSNTIKLQTICDLMKEKLQGYDWVGFYFVDTKKPDELILGPFAGEPTDHVRIKFGHGICGQAAERKETFVVDDVSESNNYLSCSAFVKSEIVVPIFKDGEVIGELDIDSHQTAAFNADDESFLKELGEIASELI